MEEEKKSRTRSQGVKYTLTPALREHIQKTRLSLDLTTEELSKRLGMNKETYNNIERRASSTKTITTDILNKLFEIFKELSQNEQWATMEQYVIGNLEKFMYSTDTDYATLQQQDWLKAYYLKYQTVNISRNDIDILFNYCPEEEIRELIKDLSKNRHIKLKTDITEENEVYINLKNKGRYPDYANYPFWCIKYADFTDTEVEEILSSLYGGNIRYSLLFALLINLELKSRRKKDYNDIFATVYNKLKMSGCINIFDRIDTIINSRKPATQKAEPTQTETADNSFVEMLKGLDLKEYPSNAKHLIEHCINGGDNFLNAFDIDLTPLYTASAYDISVFKIRLTEIINNLFK